MLVFIQPYLYITLYCIAEKFHGQKFLPKPSTSISIREYFIFTIESDWQKLPPSKTILYSDVIYIFWFSGELLLSGDGHSDWLSCAVFHPSSPRLTTSSGDGTVKLWDYSNTVCLDTLTDHQQPGMCAHPMPL